MGSSNNSRRLKSGIAEVIQLGHGSGGRLMRDLIDKLILPRLGNPILNKLADSATIDFKGEQLAFTTDSFVVSPLFFNGADIGKLAVCGTVNDLVMSGAQPRFISLAIIAEEGLDYGVLERIIDSISFNAGKDNVCIVTGDIKVVEKGACDKIFINTSGIGVIIGARALSLSAIEQEDEIIITGRIAEHGLSVLQGRRNIGLDFNIKSDCQSLTGLILPLIRKKINIKFMRDPTRGGLAAALNEVAQGCGLGILIKEEKIPVSGKVRAACELLGLDPLYIANEGKAVLVVDKKHTPRALRLLKEHPLGKYASVIGELIPTAKRKVLLKTVVGAQRIVDMPSSQDFLPRIC